MATKNESRIMLLLLKVYSAMHTVTSIAESLKLSRVGAWKVIQKLASKDYIKLKPIGQGKTSVSVVSINWDNILAEKSLALYLTEEAMEQRRWMMNFAEIEGLTNFTIIYGSILSSPKEANDIDILSIAEKKNLLKINSILETIQKTQNKKIHAINLTEEEFKEELGRQNRAFIDAAKKGVVLFGQENFIKSIKILSAQ